MQRKSKGFTLIELMIVLAIVGFMAIIAFPTFSGWLERSRLRGAARTIYSDLQLARLQAIQTAEVRRFQFQSNNGRYIIFAPGENLSERNDDVELKRVEVFEDHPGVSFGSHHGPLPDDNNVSGNGIDLPGQRVYFDAMGAARTGPETSADLINGTRNGIIYLKNERGESFAVHITPLGQIKVWKNFGGGWVD